LIRTDFLGRFGVKSGAIAPWRRTVGAFSPAPPRAQGGRLRQRRSEKNEGLALGAEVAENLALSKLHPHQRPAGLDAIRPARIDRFGIRLRSPRQAIGTLLRKISRKKGRIAQIAAS